MVNERRAAYAETLRFAARRFDRLATEPATPDRTFVENIATVQAATAIWGAYHEGFILIPAISGCISSIYLCRWAYVFLDPVSEMRDLERKSSELFHRVVQCFCLRFGWFLFPRCDWTRAIASEFESFQYEDAVRSCRWLADIIEEAVDERYRDQSQWEEKLESWLGAIDSYLENGSEADTSFEANLINAAFNALCFFEPASVVFQGWIEISEYCQVGDDLIAMKERVADFRSLLLRQTQAVGQWAASATRDHSESTQNSPNRLPKLSITFDPDVAVFIEPDGNTTNIPLPGQCALYLKWLVDNKGIVAGARQAGFTHPQRIEQKLPSRLLNLVITVKNKGKRIDTDAVSL